jgi:hypothetical protein
LFHSPSSARHLELLSTQRFKSGVQAQSGMSVEGPERFTGGCLCGSARIVASGRPYRVAVCHCLDCRKHHGALFVLGAEERLECGPPTAARAGSPWHSS